MPAPIVEQLLNTAVTHHQNGRFAEAESLYLRVLEVDPKNFDALHLLGVIASHTGRHELAVSLLSQALNTYSLDPSPHHTLGISLKCLGRLTEAEASYRRALELKPDHFIALNNLGNLLKAMGRLGEAEACYRRALELKQDFPEAHNNLGITLKSLCHLAEAEACYRRALALRPNYPEAHNNLAITLTAQGRQAEAKAHIRSALELMPNYAEAHNNLGNSLKMEGYFAEAEASYRRAVELRPNYPEAHNNLGLTLNSLGRQAEAEACYRRALELKQDFPEAHNNLGLTLTVQGRQTEAKAHIRRALELMPNYAEAHNNLGNSLKMEGRLAEAEVCYRRAVELMPENGEMLNNFALILKEQGRLSAAEAVYRRALELMPENAELHNNFSLILKAQGRLDEAEASIRRALELNKDYPEAYDNLGIVLTEQGCLTQAEVNYRRALELKPDAHEVQSHILYNRSMMLHNNQFIDLEEPRIYGRMVTKNVGKHFTSWRCHPRPGRLRIGVVSGDLRNHPVGYFLEGVLAQLDKSRLELIAYSTCVREDELSARIKPYFSSWKLLFGQSDETAAQMIHEDGVHLLLDLSGHTGHNRLSVFAWKPAPVQATWLGYWGTTGVTEMDYILVDATGVPSDRVEQFTEKVEYLPDTRLCFTAPNSAPEVSLLPALTALDGSVTFGSFQRLSKVSDQVLSLWGKVFTAQPRAQLRWQSKAFNEESIVASTLNRLEQQGIDPARIRLLGNVPRKDYLASYSEVDLILDTFPFCGGTTTSEALWQGVPTLTLAGNTLMARQGASIMTAAGLPEWVVDTEEEFVSRAVALTGSEKALTSLADLRSGLRDRLATSALFDAERFARNLEVAFWGMWERRKN